ncbi:MAG: hypothetical protein PVSMB4_05580 [Ktedonobacterales bacterium]
MGLDMSLSLRYNKIYLDVAQSNEMMCQGGTLVGGATEQVDASPRGDDRCLVDIGTASRIQRSAGRASMARAATKAGSRGRAPRDAVHRASAPDLDPASALALDLVLALVSDHAAHGALAHMTLGGTSGTLRAGSPLVLGWGLVPSARAEDRACLAAAI